MTYAAELPAEGQKLPPASFERAEGPLLRDEIVSMILKGESNVLGTCLAEDGVPS